jgi:hypothetical protein
VPTNIRINLKVNEPSVARLEHWLFGATEVSAALGDFTLQLLCGLLSVLDYVFEENLWPLAFLVLNKTGS